MRALLIASMTSIACSSAPPPPPDAGAAAPDAGFAPDAAMPPDTGVLKPCEGCTVIRHVKVLDATGPRADRRVALRANKIVLEEADDGPLGHAIEIDGTGKTLLPGLWDSHVHLPASAGPRGVPIGPDIPAHLKGHLASGVTSIFDLGSERHTILGLRDRARGGGILSPHLRAVGPLLTVPGGHPCIQRYDAEACAVLPDDASAETILNALAPLNPDMVKLVIEGGIDPLPAIPRVNAVRARAVVAAARAHRLDVIAHVSKTQDVVDALAAGVKVFAHLPVEEPLPQAVVDAIAQAKTPVITTIAVYEASAQHLIDDPAYVDDPLVAATVEPAVLAALKDPSVLRGLLARNAYTAAFRRYTDNAKTNLMKLAAAGVPIFAGSDAGNFLVFHGPGLHRELQLLVQAGLTPAAAIAAATLTPAKFFGEDQLGLVQAGYLADLLLVNGDAAADISVTSKVDSVWLNGAKLPLQALGPDGGGDFLIRVPAGGHEKTPCLGDGDCAPSDTFACEHLEWQCHQRCDTAMPSSCPVGQACLDLSGRAFCYAGSGCDPLAQDCPYAAIYKTTCTPFSPGYTYCSDSGTATSGGACDPTLYDVAKTCAEGLYCGLGNACFPLCDPHGRALPSCAGGRHCADLSMSWGAAVGLCVQ